MKTLDDKKILIGITGGISAYKVGYLASRLVQEGANVKVILTSAAQYFIGPATFGGLTGNKVYKDSDWFEGQDGINALHISLAEWTDIFVIAPATANTIAKLANGITDNLLTATVLASNCPIIIAPAMNNRMWENKITQENVKKLTLLGFHFIGPEEGKLACGTTGKGRMSEPDTIFEEIIKVLSER